MALFVDNEKIIEALKKRIDALEVALKELLTHAISCEQRDNAQNLGEIKQVLEAHKQATQDIVELLGTIQAMNNLFILGINCLPNSFIFS